MDFTYNHTDVVTYSCAYSTHTHYTQLLAKCPKYTADGKSTKRLYSYELKWCFELHDEFSKLMRLNSKKIPKSISNCWFKKPFLANFNRKIEKYSLSISNGPLKKQTQYCVSYSSLTSLRSFYNKIFVKKTIIVPLWISSRILKEHIKIHKDSMTHIHFVNLYSREPL